MGGKGIMENAGVWFSNEEDHMEEMCSNKVKGVKNKVVTTAAFTLFSNDSHV